MEDSDEWEFYFSILAMRGENGKVPRDALTFVGGLHENEPKPGYYLYIKKWEGDDAKGSMVIPVAIWRHNGELTALLGHTTIDPVEVWTNVVWRPISHEDYAMRLHLSDFEGDDNDT